MKFIKSTFSDFEMHQRYHCGDLLCCEKWSIFIMYLQQSWCLKAALSTLYCSHTYENVGSFLILSEGGKKKKGEKKQNKQPPTAPQRRLTKSHTSKDFDCSVQKEKTMWMFCGVNHEARLICQLFQVEARSAAIVSFTKKLGSFPWISHWLWLKGGGFFTLFSWFWSAG